MIGIYLHHTSQFPRNTGIQRCVRAIARGLADQGQPIVPLVWNQQRRGLALAESEALTHLARWNGPPPEAWSLEAPPPGSWLLVVELIVGASHPSQVDLRQLADRAGWKLAAVFHDAIPLGWGGVSAQNHAQYMVGLAGYDFVLANSHAMERSLRQFWQQQQLVQGLMPAPRARLQALPLAEEWPGQPRRPPEPRRSGRLRLLCVGSLESRKNHRTLLKALAWLVAQGQLDLELQLVGWAQEASVLAQVRRAQALGLPLVWAGEASDGELLEHYGSCDLTVYPSLFEGFGLPVAESLWLGKPCVCGAEGALQERTVGGGCLALDTRSWRALAAGLAQLAGDPQLLPRLQAELERRPLRRWRDYADQLMAQLQS